MKIQNILNIIKRIYESNYFPTLLTYSIIFLVLLFIIVLFLGLKDAKKSKEPKKIVEEETKDITFEQITELDNIKEDVTFEMPVLTKNLENFKKSLEEVKVGKSLIEALEEEIQKEEQFEIRKTSGIIKHKKEFEKTPKVLDKTKIEDTAINPVIKEESLIEKKELKKASEKKDISKEESKEIEVLEVETLEPITSQTTKRYNMDDNF